MRPSEPSFTPDMAGEIDSPDDQLRELAMQGGLFGAMSSLFVELVHKGCQSGIIARLPYGECSAQGAHEIIKRTLQLIGDSQGAGLRCWCLDFLIGGGVFGGKSEVQIARRFGCTRANVSYIVKELQRVLQLGEPPGGKSAKGVKAYKQRARQVHATKKERNHAPFQFTALYTKAIK